MENKKPNILKDYAERFSLRIMRLERYLKCQTDCPHAISNQILRSGTSIYANICEAQNAESKFDFSHKLSIALKEADETYGWLTNVSKIYNIHPEAMQSLISDLENIRHILVASIKTTKESIKKQQKEN